MSFENLGLGPNILNAIRDAGYTSATPIQAQAIPKVLNGLGVAIVSTSAGVFTDTQCREKGVGGEVIGHIW